MENLNHVGNNKDNICLYIELDDFSAFTLSDGNSNHGKHHTIDGEQDSNNNGEGKN